MKFAFCLIFLSVTMLMTTTAYGNRRISSKFFLKIIRRCPLRWRIKCHPVIGKCLSAVFRGRRSAEGLNSRGPSPSQIRRIQIKADCHTCRSCMY